MSNWSSSSLSLRNHLCWHWSSTAFCKSFWSSLEKGRPTLHTTNSLPLKYRSFLRGENVKVSRFQSQKLCGTMPRCGEVCKPILLHLVDEIDEKKQVFLYSQATLWIFRWTPKNKLKYIDKYYPDYWWLMTDHWCLMMDDWRFMVDDDDDDHDDDDDDDSWPSSLSSLSTTHISSNLSPTLAYREILPRNKSTSLNKAPRSVFPDVDVTSFHFVGLRVETLHRSFNGCFWFP